ncbi:MAG: GYD domain-containing protein [Nitrospiraceae bacterium]
MQTYISLVKFTQHGLQTMKEKGMDRAEIVKQNAKALGGKLVQAYYCLGKYDVVAIWEFPDNKTAMKAAVMNASMGHIQLTTMPAIGREEWKALIQDTLGKKK